MAGGEQSQEAVSQYSLPNESQGKECLAALAQKQSDGLVSLLSFRKTNGQSAFAWGTDFYIMDFEATVQFAEECLWKEITLTKSLLFNITRKGQTNNSTFNEFLYTPYTGLHAKRGSRYFIKGTLHFKKTENGWVFSNAYHSSIEPILSDTSVNKTTTSAVAPPVNVPRPPPPPSRPQLSLPYSKDELSTLVAEPAKALDLNQSTYIPKSGQFSCYAPDGFDLNIDKKLTSVRFVSSQNENDSIFVMYFKKSFGSRNLTNAGQLEAVYEARRSTLADVVFSDPIPTKLAGVDGVCIFSIGRKNGEIMLAVNTYAVGKKHVPTVNLITTPDRFPDLWEEYKRVCASYVILAE